MITEKNNVFYCDCGFSFERGRSGTHDCGTGLRKKLAESQREFRAADATIENLQMQLNAEREAKLALAAENAGLKSAINETIEWQQSTDPVNVESVRMLVDIKTPATDAFLAEARAQGVEMFAAYCGEENSVFVEAKAYYRSLPDAAYEFAAQLRKECQS